MCHDSLTAEAGPDLEPLVGDPSLAAEFPIWEIVHDRIAAGEMPPDKKPRPAEPEEGAMITDVDTGLRLS